MIVGERMREGDWITPTLRLLRPLGEGGMGKVWVAEHAGLHAEVVVKFLADDLASDAEAVARFQREAAAAAQVRSPHVVQPLDYGIATDGTPYLAMELLEGSDLRRFLADRGSIAVADVVAITAQVAKALDRAHERGVVHRDIKPENIFLTDIGGEMHVKVLDFGIAKSARAVGALKTQTGAVFGTPHYMSPEQVLGSRDVDHRTDLWALGVVVYECLTGRRPFEGESMGALAVAICHGELPAPSAVDPILAPIDDWFRRACARDPNARYANAREMAAALDAACRGVQGTVRVMRPLDVPSADSIRTTLRASSLEVARPLPTRPFVMLGALVMIALLGVLGGVMAFRWSSGGSTASSGPAPRNSGATADAEAGRLPAASIVEPALLDQATHGASASTATARKPAPPPKAGAKTSAPTVTATSPASSGPAHEPNIF